MIPATAYHLALALETAAERTMPKKPTPMLKGIKVSGVAMKDGKIVEKPIYHSVSARIAAAKSKRVRVVRRTP